MAAAGTQIVLLHWCWSRGAMVATPEPGRGHSSGAGGPSGNNARAATWGVAIKTVLCSSSRKRWSRPRVGIINRVWTREYRRDSRI